MATLSPPRSHTSRPSVLQVVASYDWWLMLSTVILVLFGLMSLYSINHNVPGPYFKRQLLNLGVGVVPFILFLVVKPLTWKKLAPLLYIFCLGLLGLVLVIGERKGGDAQRWIEVGPMQFQPSEMAKLLIVLTLASFWATRQETAKKFSTYLLSFAHVAIPMLMIYKQPHLGATLAVFATWLAVSLAMGARPRFVGCSVILGIVGLVTAFYIPGVLDDYQRSRIIGLFNPEAASTGFQVDHGLIAIGSGGLTGVGFLKGDLKASKFVPQQHNDFIVTVLGEEGGLVGIGLLIATFSVFFFRIWWIMMRAEDRFHKGVLAGILAMLSFHAIVNLGMVFKLLPVVGLWLPFLSYGGTALWLCLACVAVVLNIKAREDMGKF